MRGKDHLTAGARAPAVFSPGQCAILVDYENLVTEVHNQGRATLLDWELFRKECIRLGGPIKAGFVFMPPYMNQSEMVAQVYRQGFFHVNCPKARDESGVKDKDKVDYVMNDLGRCIFGNDPEIAHVIIVSNDGDFAPLVTFFRNRGRQVTVFGYGNISQILREAVDPENPVRIFPTVFVPVAPR